MEWQLTRSRDIETVAVSPKGRGRAAGDSQPFPAALAPPHDGKHFTPLLINRAPDEGARLLMRLYDS